MLSSMSSLESSSASAALTPSARRSLCPTTVLQRFMQATESLLRRHPADVVPPDEDALASLLPGLEVTESSWDEWEAWLLEAEGR
jgi:hypothetical protein